MAKDLEDDLANRIVESVRGPKASAPAPAPAPRSPSFSSRSAPSHAAPASDGIAAFLAKSSLFRGADASIVQAAAPHFEPRQHAAGSMLVRAGSPADGILVLYRGSASVASVNAATGQQQEIETLQPGDVFGDVGVLLNGANMHALVTPSGCSALHLRKDSFERLSEQVPGFSVAIARRLATQVVRLGLRALRPVEPHEPAPLPESALAPLQPALAAESTGVIPFVEVADFKLNPRVLSMVPLRMIQQHRVLPLEIRGKTLKLGMVTPRNTAVIAELKRALQTVDFEIAAISMDDFAQSLVRLKIGSAVDPRTRRASGMTVESLEFDINDSERDPEKELRVLGDEVVRAVNKIISQGIERDASDIHMEQDATGLRVLYRVRGMLETSNEMIPISLARACIARVKVLAGLDITERRLPQDGRIGMTAGRREVDLRVSTVPASRGEKVVLRVCEASKMLRPIEHTFTEPTSMAIARRMINAPAGAIVIAGATGSGKTSTLYSLIHERLKVRPDSNVVMVEDPIEYRLQRVTQIQTNPAVSLGFPQVLRAMLRQDPDVIVLGETRDAETAHLMLEAAITGHLLLTSLHATDAISVFQRLESLGARRSLMAQALSVIAVQRLVPQLCTGCARIEVPPPILAESLQRAGLIERSANLQLPAPAGCEQCGQSGYSGRLAVFDMLELDAELKNMLMGEATLHDLEAKAVEKRLLFSFRQYASYLLSRRLVSAADALIAVAR